MRKFIFLTTEGWTKVPTHDDEPCEKHYDEVDDDCDECVKSNEGEEDECSNCQELGRADGETVSEAWLTLLREEPHLHHQRFDREGVFALELLDGLQHQIN